MVFFFPKTIEKRTSKLNGTIEVVKLLGSYSLVVAGYTQSGGLIQTIWEKSLRKIKKDISKRNPKILILGLGAGTAAQIANHLWPKAEIKGIELDPEVIRLANKYFNLNQIPNLEIIIDDAIDWVNPLLTTHNPASPAGRPQLYDLILVDLYLGGNVVPQSRSKGFLESLNNLLAENGVVLINQLIKKEKKGEAVKLKKTLSKVFPRVERIPTPANAVFAGYSK